MPQAICELKNIFLPLSQEGLESEEKLFSNFKKFVKKNLILLILIMCPVLKQTYAYYPLVSNMSSIVLPGFHDKHSYRMLWRMLDVKEL